MVSYTDVLNILREETTDSRLVQRVESRLDQLIGSRLEEMYQQQLDSEKQTQSDQQDQKNQQLEAQMTTQKINHITEEAIRSSAKLEKLSPDPSFDKWQSTIELSEDYSLSVIAGKYYMSCPKHNMPKFEQYVEYEAAFLSKDGFVMFGEIFEDNEFEISPYEEVWPYKSMEDIVQMANMLIDHINKEAGVQNA